MSVNVEYDYDEVINFCKSEGQNSILDLSNDLNGLSDRMTLCQDSFHSKENLLVIGEIYNAFSAITGSSATKSGVAGLNVEAANILNICYAEAMNDKKILESEIIGQGNSVNGGISEPSQPLENINVIPENSQVQSPPPEPIPNQPANTGQVLGTLSPGTTKETYQAQAYNLDSESYKTLCATVYAEASELPDYIVSDSMGVTSAICNRADAGNWGGSTVIDVVSASGQFSGYGYQNEKFAAAMNDPSVIPAEMRAAIDRVLAGERNTTGVSFSGNGTYNSFR